MRLKHLLASLLAPAAALADGPCSAARRLWAHARLRQALGPCVHPSVVAEGCPELHGTRRVMLGRNLYLYPGQYWETRGTGTVSIGNDVVLSRGVHLAAHASIEIGCGSMIGEYTSIRDAGHGLGTTCLRRAPQQGRPIRIGREVWIGRGVTVLAGVQIGDGAVVGANAVVTHDVPPGYVVAGVPARIIGDTAAREAA